MSTCDIKIWRTWALAITHEAGAYTEQKFNAEKTGGEPDIPSPNLDTDLVMACDRLADVLIKAYKNPIKMQIDIARYSKLISPKNTGHNEEKEEKLLERCPPGHEGTKLVDKPATILDASSTIIAWYLPDTLTETTQKEIRAATDFLGPSLEKSVKADGNWRYNQEWFKQGSENVGSTPGCINLSPAWFQQGHKVGCDEMVISGVKLTNPIESVRSEVSASLKGPSSENILKAIARPAAIASVALRVMHPQQYFAGLRALSHLRDKALSKELPQMPETLQYWASVFNSLSIISNRETPNHRDHLSIPECFDILNTMGNYSNARMSMPSLQLEFRIVRHGVDGGEGDWIAWAWLDTWDSAKCEAAQLSAKSQTPAAGTWDSGLRTIVKTVLKGREIRRALASGGVIRLKTRKELLTDPGVRRCRI
ncbi:hypothetical protein BDR07DRAFT_1372205 [Suillus spraguei]|nr:hypothetical protein BDR07DRAFT_1372205 [Suillus spraguei]